MQSRFQGEQICRCKASNVTSYPLTWYFTPVSCEKHRLKPKTCQEDKSSLRCRDENTIVRVVWPSLELRWRLFVKQNSLLELCELYATLVGSALASASLYSLSLTDAASTM